MPAGVQGSNKAPPLLSVTGQPLDGAPAMVHERSGVGNCGMKEVRSGELRGGGGQEWGIEVKLMG